MEIKIKMQIVLVHLYKYFKIDSINEDLFYLLTLPIENGSFQFHFY